MTTNQKLNLPLAAGESGWVKPRRSATLQELRTLIAQKRVELKELERQAQTLEQDAKLHAIADARNLMRAYQIDLAELFDGEAPAYADVPAQSPKPTRRRPSPGPKVAQVFTPKRRAE